jgi:hypothetical protein
MADIILSFSDAHMARIAAVVDNIWPGRTEQEPVPSKAAWFKYHVIQNIKQQVLVAEKQAVVISEIEVT